MVFRVLNYNAALSGTYAYWVGQGQDAKVGVSVALEKLAKFLVINTDGHRTLIGVQEIDRRTSRAGKLDVPETLAGRMHGFDSQFVAVMPYQGGDYGLANLHDVTKISAQGWRFAWDQNNATDYGREPRGANATKHDFGGDRRLWFVNTHLGKVPGDEGVTAHRQLFELLGKMKTFDPDYPVIVVGDFNIEPSMTGPYAALLKLFNDHPLSGFRLVYEDDRMYIFKFDPHQRLIVLRRPHKVSPVWEGVKLSDHNLLVAEFEWR